MFRLTCGEKRIWQSNQNSQNVMSVVVDTMLEVVVNPIQDGLFWGCSRIGGGQKGPPSLKSVTHPTMMKLGTVIPYQKKIQNI